MAGERHTSTAWDPHDIQHQRIQLLLGRIARVGGGIGCNCGDGGQRASLDGGFGETRRRGGHRGGIPIPRGVNLGHGERGGGRCHGEVNVNGIRMGMRRRRARWNHW